MKTAAESLPHPFRRGFAEVAALPEQPKQPKPELGNLGFFTMSFVSWFIIIFGMIA